MDFNRSNKFRSIQVGDTCTRGRSVTAHDPAVPAEGSRSAIRIRNRRSGPDGALIAVLDVDSDRLDAFDEDDQRGMEKIVALFRD